MSTDVRTRKDLGRWWSMAVAFSIIGLVDALLGESLAIIGFELFLIPASAWIVANIALLVILFGPERRQSRL
jgi:hypothetical protein